MKVLVVNCGSSSLKYQLIDMDNEQVIAKGLCERIGLDMGHFVYKVPGKDDFSLDTPIPNHEVGVQLVLDTLVSPERGIIASLGEIGAVGHRVVHGGEKFASSVLITDEVIKAIEECSELAPLHNPANLIGINVCAKLMPGVPMVAVFDTAFHQTMPEKAYIYGIPYKCYEDLKVRKYGFHGTSHKYVTNRVAEVLGKPASELKTIVCHLGNGASICAVNKGQSVDTSMGFTPIAGLVMGTRCGDIDPSILEFLCDKMGKDIHEVTNMLNKKSGMEGLTGGLSDFRDIDAKAEAGDAACARALEIFMYRVASTVGAYVAAMNGVDAIAFTAGIGENSKEIREGVCKYFEYLGVTIDAEENAKRGTDAIISTPDSKVKVLRISTNEELMIARDTLALAK